MFTFVNNQLQITRNTWIYFTKCYPTKLKAGFLFGHPSYWPQKIKFKEWNAWNLFGAKLAKDWTGRNTQLFPIRLWDFQSSWIFVKITWSKIKSNKTKISYQRRLFKTRLKFTLTLIHRKSQQRQYNLKYFHGKSQSFSFL